MNFERLLFADGINKESLFVQCNNKEQVYNLVEYLKSISTYNIKNIISKIKNPGIYRFTSIDECTVDVQYDNEINTGRNNISNIVKTISKLDTYTKYEIELALKRYFMIYPEKNTINIEIVPEEILRKIDNLLDLGISPVLDPPTSILEISTRGFNFGGIDFNRELSKYEDIKNYLLDFSKKKGDILNKKVTFLSKNRTECIKIIGNLLSYGFSLGNNTYNIDEITTIWVDSTGIIHIDNYTGAGRNDFMDHNSEYIEVSTKNFDLRVSSESIKEVEKIKSLLPRKPKEINYKGIEFIHPCCNIEIIRVLMKLKQDGYKFKGREINLKEDPEEFHNIFYFYINTKNKIIETELDKNLITKEEEEKLIPKEQCNKLLESTLVIKFSNSGNLKKFIDTNILSNENYITLENEGLCIIYKSPSVNEKLGKLYLLNENKDELLPGDSILEVMEKKDDKYDEEKVMNFIKAGIYHLCNCNSKVFEFKSKEELQKFLNYYSIQLPKKIKKRLSFPINIDLRSDWSYNWEIKEAKDTSFVDKDPIKYIDQVEDIYISVIRKHGKEILKNINKKVYVLGKEELTKEVVKFLGLELESSLSKTDYVIGYVIEDLAYYCKSRYNIKVGGYYKTIEGYDLKKVEKVLTFLGFDVLGFSKQSRIFTLEDGYIGGVACIPKFINAEPKDITADIEMIGSTYFPETWEKTDIQELAKKERENSEKKGFEGLKEKYYEVLDNLKTSKEYRKQVRDLIIERLGSAVRIMEVINYSLMTSPTVTILEEIGYVHIPCNNLLIMSLPFERVDINKVGTITGITPEGQMKLLTDIYNLCKKEDNNTENKVTTEPTARREIRELLRREVFFSLISANANRRVRFIFENKYKLKSFFKYFGMIGPVCNNYPTCIELTMNSPSSDILYSIGSESSDGRTDINQFIETIDKYVDTILRNYKKVLEKDYQDKIVWSKYCSTIEKKFLDFIGIKHTEKKEEVKGNKGGTTVIRDLVSYAIDGDKDVISNENTSNYFKVMDLLKIDLGSREKVREIIDGCTGIFSSGNIIKITGEGKYVNILQEILQELKLHITKTPSEIVVSNPISTINNVNVSIYNESAKRIYEEISKEIIKNN